MKRLRVLIACECSQTVCEQFRALGDECYSCDILDQYGGHPEWHIMQDALDLLDGDCAFFYARRNRALCRRVGSDYCASALHLLVESAKSAI